MRMSFSGGLTGVCNIFDAGAPSPILPSLGFGVKIPFDNSNFGFSPYAQFFCNYWLWDESSAGNMALPAEVEFRTAIVPQLIIDLPFYIQFPVGKCIFSGSLGISILTRYGFLASGVPLEDQGDVEKINNYFWSSFRWFSPSFQFMFDYVFDNDMMIGFDLRGYLPITSFIEGWFIHNGVASLQIHFSIPLK